MKICAIVPIFLVYPLAAKFKGILVWVSYDAIADKVQVDLTRNLGWQPNLRIAVTELPSVR